jgi:hypothetical protein
MKPSTKRNILIALFLLLTATGMMIILIMQAAELDVIGLCLLGLGMYCYNSIPDEIYVRLREIEAERLRKLDRL